MKVGAVILARMSSQRLPGKPLRDLAGAPLIDRVVDRVRRIGGLDDWAVAMSDHPSDDALAEHCRRSGWPVFRGALEHVVKRMADCAMARGWDYLVRVNGDSPFLLPDLIASGIRTAIDGRLDMVTNLHPRSYPYGVAVEIMRTRVFLDGMRRMSEAEDLEHPTRYFYRHIHELRFHNLSCSPDDWTSIRLTVDTEEDLQRAASLTLRLGAGAGLETLAGGVCPFFRAAENCRLRIAD